MKKLLLYTYYFPPQPEAGSLRPQYLSKHLPEFGWEATVITPETWPGHSRKRHWLSRYRWTQAARSLIHTINHFPDAGRRWVRLALRRGLAAAHAEQFDAVMSTALPATMHILGSLTAKKTRLPWLADYRDLWSGNPYRKFGPVRLAVERRMERSLLSNAAAVTTVSNGCAEVLQRLLRRDDIYVIPNAFDEADWSDIEPCVPKEFQLCYAGRLYADRRTPEMLFAAASALRKSQDPAGLNLRFAFYGPDAHIVRECAKRFDIEEAVEINDVIERRACLKTQRAAAGVIVLLSSDAGTSGEFGSKIFESIGARRPVLVTGPPDSVVRTLVADSGMGIFVSSVDECSAAIRRLHDDFRDGRFEPDLKSSWTPFTARMLAERFASVLNKLTDGVL